jgi:AcrR family transcriptional regulator
MSPGVQPLTKKQRRKLIKTDHRRGPRPGGRTARNTAAVLQTAFRLLTSRGLEKLTVAEVAAKSGVHPATIYRRWQTIEALALEASLHGISSAIPIPQLGSLRADLVALVRAIIEVLDGPRGGALLDICRISDPKIAAVRAQFMSTRFEAAAVIFDRAAKRGEWNTRLGWKLPLELLIAPIYLRALVTGQPLRELPVTRMVNVVLAIAKTGSKAR